MNIREFNNPEVLIITEKDENHPLLLSLAGQLIEKGIFFQFIKPPDFDSLLLERNYKVILIDEKMLLDIINRKDEVSCRFEDFMCRNFIFTLKEFSCETTGILGISEMSDHYNRSLINSIVSYSELTIPHPGMNFLQLQRRNSEILAAFEERLCKRLAKRHSWNEFLLHDWKAALYLANDPRHHDVRDLLVNSINNASNNFPEGIHHDELGGFFATAWLYENTGNKKPFEKMLLTLDEVLQRRPRINGVICGCGFEDDPLLINHNSNWNIAGTTVRRKVIFNESLHFLGPSVGAATRITGDIKYSLEAVNLIRYLKKYHQDSDGMFFHASKNQKPLGEKWSRGIAHALYGMLYLLEELGEITQFRDEILDIIRNTANGLKLYQDRKTGLWRNVVDNPESRIESSGSTCFAYVLLKCINAGWLSRTEFYDMAQRAFTGLKNVYWKGGLCCMCRGTGTGDMNYYLSRPQGWGIVPQFIMVIYEYEKSLNNQWTQRFHKKHLRSKKMPKATKQCRV